MDIIFKMICLLTIYATLESNVMHDFNNEYLLHAFGSRSVVFVAFGGNYTFDDFTSNLRSFAFALNCPSRHQFITFYFGDLLTKIDCDYRNSLVDCVNGDRILGNRTNAINAYEVDLK